jgi:NAD(P)-dependent dehydrogenase (short-subunit alcohol dehydrogenase family)
MPIALVTGANRGIGRETARQLAEWGYDVIVTARDDAKAAEAAAAIGGRPLQLDVADPGSIERAAAMIADDPGALDVLVNNAGVGIGAPIADTQTKYLDMQLAVNVRSMVLLSRECMPLLKEAGAEHGKALIVNTASIAGKYPQGFLGIYSATKHAVVGFSGALHKEHQNDGIQVTALCPGFVDTAMADFVKGQIPAEQMIRPEDIGAAVTLLLKTSPACIIPEIQFLRRGDSVP